MTRLGYLIHDALAHPLCAVLWIVGAKALGDRLHDATVFAANREEEVWPQ